ncbi:30S ribosomal protein S15 [Streptococcus pneumoniae 2081074]|nr:30S ribosomal protein S15 [Streptococcus pneumoniae 2081074]
MNTSNNTKRPRYLPWIDEKIGRRRNLLAYLRKNDVNRYRELINSLGLRR